MKVLFLIRNMLLPANSIYRRAANLIINMYDNLIWPNYNANLHSPVVDICRRARTYVLLNLILETSDNTNSNYGQIKKDSQNYYQRA